MTQVARNKKSEFSQHTVSLTGLTQTFSSKLPVLAGLEFSISLKIIAKIYFQLNCSAVFSLSLSSAGKG